MKSPKEIKESHYFHETHSRVAHRTLKAKLTERLRKKNSRKRLMLAQRPPFSGVRSLINSPSQGDFSSKRDLSPQENPFPELLAISEPLFQDTIVNEITPRNGFEENVPIEDTPVPQEETAPENTVPRPAALDSTVTHTT